ncbi:MAG: uL14 family ribosomal protein, partial [Planctomycetes bacterium]|nr:uL14 family ribosomal protein [Planctomycetota bacterium]
MIQMQTMVDVCDNTGAKSAMVFNVYKGSTAGRGKYRLKQAKTGDIVMVAVQQSL